jgi:hypothetical protein
MALELPRIKPGVDRRYLVLRLLGLGAGLLLAVLLLSRLWSFVGYVRVVFDYPYQIDYDEGINLHAAWLLSQGQAVYAPFTPDHFVSALYTPLFYFLSSITLHWTGPSLEVGRLIILVSTVGIAIVLALLTANATHCWPAGVLSGLFFLALSPVYVWANLYKQDMLAVFFTVAGIYTVQRLIGSRFLYAAAVPFALAFFTKQTALVGPATACLYLLARDSLSSPRGLRTWQGWHRAVILAGSTAAAILIPFALLDVLTGHDLWVHVLTPRKFPWIADRLVKNLTKLASVHPYLIGLAAAVAAYLSYRRWHLLFPIYLLVATGAILLANGYRSANYNMLLDVFPPLCLLAGTIVGEAWNRRRMPLMAGVLVGALILLSWQALNLSSPDSWYHGLPDATRGREMSIIENFVATSRGPILSEDVGTLIRAGKDTDYDDPYAFSALAKAGAWDDSALAAKIKAHYYTFILLDYDITDLSGALRWSPKVFQAMKDNYEVLYRDFLFTYKPKSGP